MPELTEDMYCSQQICIPPSFPYLLRQYAKAAIRTQPQDLLRWSTAYFRCLSLNLRPPVKPRLEYPIPRSYCGITPGWLKALCYQLQGNITVSYKILWDRWIGACLQHKNLIQILCLGGFMDPMAIPWFHVVGLCAGCLTDDLTHTMILVCEILTEEPEGGSAAIPLEVFMDVYKFLAAIDASEPQILRNLVFSDSLLSLYREPPVVVEKEPTIEPTIEEEEEYIAPEEEKVEEVEKGSEEDLIGVVISCPDIAPDDYKTEEDFLKEQEGKAQQEALIDEPSALEETKEEEVKEETVEIEGEGRGGEGEFDEEKTTYTEKAEEESESEEEEVTLEEMKPKESIDTIIDYMPPRAESSEELLLDEYKQECYEEEEEPYMEIPLELLGITEPSVAMSETVPTESTVETETIAEEGGEEEEEGGEEVYIDAIPGIGPIVSESLVEAVEVYMTECSKWQHGLVMPRNIRHYNCPPLEFRQITL